MSWKIEVFHKMLKSGCKAEESKLRTAQRLTNLISLFYILSWRVFWMTMLNRSAPDAPPTLALTATEIGVLDRLVNDKPKARRKALSHYLIKIARLGGYLARASDPPPGNTVMWRELSRLTDIALGGGHPRRAVAFAQPTHPDPSRSRPASRYACHTSRAKMQGAATARLQGCGCG
ncbi:hypothetical protein [Bradyrhizobium glycinis]|uniref:hypothetical protein n=1 Tax=Bradyrhizobium glycinis TaxID=2751812 RepID=UPI001FEAA759|nr:hypothetical protein [Bradyrhizobium glycinis]